MNPPPRILQSRCDARTRPPHSNVTLYTLDVSVYTHIDVQAVGCAAMSKVVTLRLSDSTAARLQAVARRAGRSVSETGARSIEEWLRAYEFAEIEFRDFEGERLVCLKGGIRLWKLIMVAQHYDLDPEKTAAHFEFPVYRVKAALNYYAAYPEEIDRIIAENRAVTFEDLQRMLPNIERFSVPRDVAAAALPN